ncbi:hypothetical protein [Pseudosulfitobacter sp. DSM 107133]|uniref:hypothetical protein n=1 Tax=Pseudosulfitobacter sp. DSM 107133 TaxID=2883100 RepID=UPI00196653CE|nr:hypothetical protein [Pseudosulfitobacter sp. DSM 107133]
MELGKDCFELKDLLPAITAFAVHISPAIAALAWAHFSTVSRVKVVMKLTAKLVTLVVISLFIYLYLAETLCDGSAVKGFVRCSFFPASIANLSVPIYLLSVTALGVWCLVVTAICGWAEIAALRERSDRQ